MALNQWGGLNDWGGESQGISISITESFNGFSESITANISPPGVVNVTITETFSGFSESISIKLPTAWTDKPAVITVWNGSTKSGTIWTDK